MHLRDIAVIAFLLLAALTGRAQDGDPKRVSRPENERHAIKEIEKISGIIGFDSKAAGLPVNHVNFHDVTDYHLELLAEFPQLEELLVKGGSVSEAGFSQIARLSRLKFLHVRHSIVTEAGLASIAKLTQLENLELEDCTIAEAGLSQLTNLVSLKKLNFRRSTISDASLPHLVRLTGVRDLDLSETQVTAAGLAQLKEALPYAIIVNDRGHEKMEYEYFFEFLAAAAAVALGGIGAGFLFAWRPRVRSRPWICKGAVVVLAVGVMSYGLSHMATPMRPVQEGDAGEFWLHVCAIDVGAKNPRRPWGGFYLPRDGWFIYYDSGFHGEFLHRVRASQCQALFPKLVEKLRNAPPGVLRPHVEEAYRASSQSGSNPNDAASFLKSVSETRLSRIRANEPKLFEYAASKEGHFDERWTRIKLYHWNVWFEFAYLVALIFFTAWPWLRNASRVQWAIHLGLLPCLFCLPYWLGYATLTFTSAGPSGGVLYPWLIAPLRGMPWSELDTMILNAIPHPLMALSQTPGPMLSLSNQGGVGPVSMIITGLVIALAVAAGPETARWSAGKLRGYLR